jgi:hypothetical protein
LAKIITIVFVVLVVLIAGVYLYLRKYVQSPDLSKDLNERLVQLVKEKSNGLYKLSIGNIQINVDKQSALLQTIKLVADSTVLNTFIVNGQSPKALFNLSLENVLIKNVDILSFLNNKSATLNVITVAGGELIIHRLKDSKKDDENTKSSTGMKDQKKNVVKRIKNSVSEVRIDSLMLDNINLSYYNLRNQKKQVKKVHLDLYSILIDSTSAMDSNRIFFARSMRVSIDSLSMPMAENKYKVSADKLIVSIGNRSITTIKGISLSPNPKTSLESAASKTSVQKDIFKLHSRDISIDDFDYSAFLEDSLVLAKAVVIDNPELEVFNDKSNPPATKSKVGQYPHQLLKKISYSTNIPQIIIKNGSITYFEKNEKGDGIGKINFTKVNGNVGPIRTGKFSSGSVKATFTALFMGKSGIDVKFNFPVSNNGSFSVDARFDPFNVTQLNTAALPLGNTKLTEGRVNRLSFTVNGSNYSATGAARLNYENLKIEVMKQGKKNGYKKNGLLSFVANEFFLRENNSPTDKFPDEYKVSYQRVPTKSFFNLIWKTVFYSVKANTGVGAKGKDKERAKIY